MIPPTPPTSPDLPSEDLAAASASDPARAKDCGGDPPCWEGHVDDHRDHPRPDADVSPVDASEPAD